MAGSTQFPARTGANCYVVIRDRNGRPWSTSGGTGGFETFTSGNYADYAVAAVEQGITGWFVGNFPAALPPGYYNLDAHEQAGGTPLQTDLRVAGGTEQWNGSELIPLSDLATSSQLGFISPLRPARGVMIQNFPVYFKSATDHVTPFTSGSGSGQIWRDGAVAPVALQSGAFTEVGNGWYNLQALTSGDLLANSVKILFSCGISGVAQADPVPMAFLLQRTSGQ